jgi:predicted ATPase/transcriptional regulator with XRE-family HTH domain
MKDSVQSFGLLLRQRRKGSGLTQVDLASQVPCSPDMIRKIESGIRKPSRSMAKRLAVCLDVPRRAQQAWVNFARTSPGASDQSDWIESIRPPTNLPASLTPLVGRETDLIIIHKILRRDTVRLLSLVGPPGVGKTRLGLQVATDIRDFFKDGVYFVPLGSISDSNLVIPAISNKVDLKDLGTRSPVDNLIDFLWDKQILLLLDNFEQVVDAAQSVVKLLSECPLMKVLVTSRVTLQVRGEHQYSVQPLALPDQFETSDIEKLSNCPSIALFLDRAQAVMFDFQLTETNSHAVSTICRRLDGLPLAIEMVAALMHILSPRRTLERLDDLFLNQSNDLRDLGSRQQTLYNAIMWSYNLLSPKEQMVFERLAVFVGRWSLEDAESICSDTNLGEINNGLERSEILNLHASLLNKSLIEVEEKFGRTYFTMLYTIRGIAQKKLEQSGDMRTFKNRHSKHFLDLSQTAVYEWRGIDQVDWFNRFEVEHENLIAALDWLLKRRKNNTNATLLCMRLACALMWFWSRRNYLREGHIWTEKVLARSLYHGSSRDLDREHTRLRAKVLYSLGTIDWLLGDLNQAKHLLNESITLWDTLAEDGELGRAYTQISQLMVEKELDNTDQSRMIGQECVATLTECRDEWGLALALNCLGSAELQAGEDAQAHLMLEKSANLFRSMGDEWGLSLPLIHLTHLLIRQGRFYDARLVGEESLGYLIRTDDRQQIAYLLKYLGDSSRSLKDYQQAVIYYEESLNLWKTHGHRSFAKEVQSKLEEVICSAES